MKNLVFKKVTLLTLMVIVVFSSFSFATTPVDNENCKYNKHNQNLINIVSEYSPEALDEWKQVIEERNNLMKELRQKHSENKGIVDGDRKSYRKKRNEYLDNLRIQIEKGELTRKEAREKYQEYKLKGKRMESDKYHNKARNNTWVLKKDLEKAISEKDSEKIKVTLDNMYKEFKELNLKMKSKLEQI